MTNSRFWLLAEHGFSDLQAAQQILRVHPRAGRQAANDRLLKYGKKRSGGTGIAILPLLNVLTHARNSLTDLLGGTAMDEFGYMLDNAVADPSIGTIVIEVDSPGGEAVGTPELAARVRAAAAKKPVLAAVVGLCASAAYWVASAATEVVATPSADVGSIGVIMILEDDSQALQNQGIRINIIREPVLKGVGSPWEPLPEAAREILQSQIQAVYSQFVQGVAENRGKSPDFVRANMGRGMLLLAPQAKAAGMVDRLMPFDQLLGALVSEASTRRAEMKLHRQMHTQRKKETAHLLYA